jgi:hypothetical protein
MLPWSDEEIARFQVREQFLVGRGLSPKRAEGIADRLALRDQQGDDRRICIECSHAYVSAKGAGCRVRQPIVHNVLARCAGFKPAIQ